MLVRIETSGVCVCVCACFFFFFFFFAMELIFGWILIVAVVEEASFDCGFGGCQLVIFVVVGEERERERERRVFFIILLGGLYYFIGLYEK